MQVRFLKKLDRTQLQRTPSASGRASIWWFPGQKICAVGGTVKKRYDESSILSPKNELDTGWVVSIKFHPGNALVCPGLMPPMPSACME